MATPFLLPHWPDAPANIGALSTLRGGGVSPAPYGDGQGGGGLNLGVHVGDRADLVQRNRYLLQGVLPTQPAWLTQVHGSAALDASDIVPGHAPEADASFTAARGAVCAILTADCLPVLFCDADGKVVAAAHAGWRGLAGGVLAHTVRAMRGAGAGDILAWLGPAIGPSQFEVGADVLQAFRAGAEGAGALAEVEAAFAPLPGRPGKYLADIYALARSVLRRDGVGRIAGGEFCTVSDAARFYSYRRDGVTGRQASLIWRK
ncbi:peptidoglycan editing factor PgeF [Janthinobacterium fluminis]|uniref:Purine nucleoside phosphorylase n=1 Tax=Janthinobacterium fluminis TaxID=2987524 RepID=A0ABT5K5X4_9BURK|nr:peptidoglycan editing factor PgeF [Janthinobacterium fluminis]MDC8760383.1 peptidoglycan editing factor PgeF [Janthinobacterium fluminis]